MSDYWRVAIVEDHLLQRRRTEQLIGAESGLRIVHSCETFPQFSAWLERTTAASRPHLVLLDLMVERGPSVEPDAVRRLVDSGLRVLVVSAMASLSLTREILRAGAAGVVGKRDPETDLVAAAWTVLGRRPWITPELAAVMASDPSRPRLSVQEERALVLYASGYPLASVAEVMGVQPDTAKKYLARVRAKYVEVGRPASSKLDLHRVAVQDGLLQP